MNYQTNLADEQLIQYFLNGDSNAMSTLVELYKDRIYSSIYVIVQDKYQAEAIFRAVFIKIIDYTMAGKTADEGKFLPWAMSIAHGLCIEHTRSTASENLLNSQTPSHTSALNDFIVPAIATNGSSFESHGRIRNMIDMLPEQQREVIVLNHYGGLSFKEISELMKCSVNSALETMRFGLRNLKLMIEKEVSC